MRKIVRSTVLVMASVGVVACGGEEASTTGGSTSGATGASTGATVGASTASGSSGASGSTAASSATGTSGASGSTAASSATGSSGSSRGSSGSTSVSSSSGSSGSSGSSRGSTGSSSTGGSGSSGSTGSGINYNDTTRFANKLQDATCPAGFQKTYDPYTSKCITTAECIDPGVGGVCRAYCANRNVYGPQPKTGPDFECISSVDVSLAASSEWWPNSCDQVANNALGIPTKIDIDCRCQNQLGRGISADPRFDRCLPPVLLQNNAKRISTGPSISALRGDKGYTGGYLESATRKFIVGGKYSDAPWLNIGLIFSVDIDTGVRTLIAGAYNDPINGIQRTGCTGTPQECASTSPIADDLRNVEDVKKGPDGNTYAYVNGPGIGTQIWRVDVTNGRHTLIWKEEIVAANTAQKPSATVNSNQCWNGVPATSSGVKVIQLHPNGWTMDTNGNHYFAVLANGSPVGPNGIVRISADGTTCSWVTRYFNDAPSTSGPLNEWRNLDLGTGNIALVRFDWRALLFHTDGFLYARNASALAKIDINNGNRIIVANADTQARVGQGGAMGDRWLVWDGTRNRMWSIGGGNSTVLSGVDLSNGDRDDFSNAFANKDWYKNVKGPLGQNYQLRGGMIFDDRGEKDAIVVHNNSGITRYEIRTGNSVMLTF